MSGSPGKAQGDRILRDVPQGRILISRSAGSAYRAAASWNRPRGRIRGTEPLIARYMVARLHVDVRGSLPAQIGGLLQGSEPSQIRPACMRGPVSAPSLAAIVLHRKALERPCQGRHAEEGDRPRTGSGSHGLFHPAAMPMAGGSRADFPADERRGRAAFRHRELLCLLNMAAV